jgi:hypothetical protein
MQLVKIINSAILVPKVSISVSWLLNLSWCDAAWSLSFVSVMLAPAFSMSVSWLPEASSFYQCCASSCFLYECDAGS